MLCELIGVLLESRTDKVFAAVLKLVLLAEMIIGRLLIFISHFTSAVIVTSMASIDPTVRIEFG